MSDPVPETGRTVDGFQSTILSNGSPAADAGSQSTAPGFAVTGQVRTRSPIRELQSGDRIGRYVILTRIGHGGMGIIYGAQDPDLDRRVALKFLLGRDGAGNLGSARLLREAQSLAQLSHPNIVAVHDVGILDDRVWVAMELLDGPNLARWINEKQRPWREVLPVFLAAGAGLQAAHAAGFVHRDFKPENVMFGRDGRVRVVDFGLARAEQAKDGGDAAPGAAMPPPEDMRLTMTGSLLGTPRYMAPEQWSGALADAKSDQFAFCVSLWEGLFGEPPFAASTLPELMTSVAQGRLKAPRLAGKTPSWIRAALTRGLSTSPAARWPSMGALLVALQGDPRRKARLVVLAGAIALVGVTAVVWWRQEQARLAAEVDTLIMAADSELEAFSIDLAAAVAVRTEAMTAFDSGAEAKGNSLWGQYLTAVPVLEQRLSTSMQTLEAALDVDGRRADVRRRLAETLFKRALLAEENGQDPTLIREMIERLKLYDIDGEQGQRWSTPAALAVNSEPPGAHVVLERFAADHREVLELRDLGATPVSRFTLHPGSYRLRLDSPGYAPVLYPILLARAEEAIVEVSPPRASKVPEGFIFVPPGRFLYGSADAESVRSFLRAEPRRSAQTGPYLIARDEVTYEDYILFLEAQSAADRASLLVKSESNPVQLEQRPEGGWRLTLRLSAKTHTVDSGAPLVYEGRSQRSSVTWERLPVLGITETEANAYLAWLDRDGKVPGARYCNEYEWERAARGADGRLFPGGDTLRPEDANFDATYGNVPTAFGPDPVGSYPQKPSPFGLHDMAGNAYELTLSNHAKRAVMVRGGGYFYGDISQRATARFEYPPELRDAAIGLRVCATWPPPPAR